MAQIDKPNTHFTTRTYTASGAGSVSDVSFQPDFLWFKNRTVVGNHGLMDSVRGIKKILHSNDTNQEATSPANNDFETFTSNGFTYGTSSALDSGSGTPVTWLWKAGGTAVSNTAGSITSSVSANTTAGFSVVTWSGNNSAETVGHGLSSAPSVVILKWRNGADNWYVQHKSLASTDVIRLDATNAKIASDLFQDTYPTSSVFSIKSGYNLSGRDFVAYCFAEKKGFSKFGSYVGNSSATDGTFVYLGFKPAFVIIKGATNASSWLIQDNKRQTYNDGSIPLFKANTTDAEIKIDNFDMLSNGFKCRTSNNDFNGANTYIYMAFAENPLVGTNNIPATAR